MVIRHNIGVLVRGDDDLRLLGSAVGSNRDMRVVRLLIDRPWPEMALVVVDASQAPLAREKLDATWSESAGPRPPLLALVPEGQDPTPVLSSGVDDVLCKPLHSAEVEARLATYRRLIETSHLHPAGRPPPGLGKSDEAFHEYALRLTIALDAAKMGDIEYDFRTDEITCDFPVYRLLGYTDVPQGSGASVILDRIHHDDREAFRQNVRSAMAGETSWQQEFRVVWPDGTIRWLVARGEVFQDSDHRPSRLIGVVRDATEERQMRLDLVEAKHEAERLADLKSSFVANMSHEIRTPLTAIIGFASLLASRVPEEHQLAIQRIQEGGQRLLDTLNAVLMLARLDAGQMDLHIEEVDVYEEAVAMASLLEQQAHEKGLDLYVIREGDGPSSAKLDRSLFGSVLQNLVSNAIKFTEHGEIRITVTTRPRHGRQHVWVEVRDTGVGITEDFLPHVFDEFKQEAAGLKQQQGGAGLGLSITKRIVSRLGGIIEVESKKGHGATFKVGFERWSPPGGERREAQMPVRAHGSQHPPSVLIVEDNDETRGLLEALLQDYCRVTLAADARNALRATYRQSFDVVLMDINLGEGVSGEEVAARLFDRPDFGGTPVVALTAYALPGDRERFIAKGFAAHLAKPFAPSALIELIERLSR